MGLGVWGFGVWGLGFGVWGWGLGISGWELGIGVQGARCRVHGFGLVVQISVSWFRVWELGFMFRVQGPESRVQGSGFRFSGFLISGFRVCGSEFRVGAIFGGGGGENQILGIRVQVLGYEGLEFWGLRVWGIGLGFWGLVVAS